MLDHIRKTLHPERYHGTGKRPPFFEGWYFKLVSADRRERFAIIPGIFLSDDPTVQHAFVQVFDGVSGAVSYHRFPAEQFRAIDDPFAVSLGANQFRMDQLTLDIHDDLRSVSGTLRFGAATPWRVNTLEPGVMGWLGYLPFLECYHGVLSFDHPLEGALTVDGRTVDFTGGHGYIEKDWGKSFPGGWVWMQTNHFAESEGTSFTGACAITPLLRGWFPGFLAGVWHQGELHRFASYSYAKIDKLEVTEHTVDWVVSDKQKRLEINARRAEASILPGPSRHDMGVRVPETLKAVISIALTRADGGIIFEGTGTCAGLEVAGDLDKLLKAL
ncbi:MAG: hypothetical protein IPO91_09750 [Chloroflexi bacterium]|nr:hypothetical protein [Chloroflexota bacterium]